MPYAFPKELRRLVDDQLASGSFESEDQVLIRAMKLLEEKQIVAAIQAGIDDCDAGRVMTLDEMDADIKSRLRFLA